jgi:hypothetical protein
MPRPVAPGHPHPALASSFDFAQDEATKRFSNNFMLSEVEA